MAKTELTDERLAELSQTYALFDEDGDGVISLKDMGSMMDAMGYKVTDKELKGIMKKIDLDGNGVIDFNEFSAMMGPKKPVKDDKAELLELFNRFDGDGDGFIDTDELRRVMNRLGECFTDEDVNEMVREADMDGDGRISYDEFEIIMLPKGK